MTIETASRTDAAMAAMVGYIAGHCSPDGRFAYAVSGADGRALGRDYNILRHCGTIYALTEYHEQRPDARAAQTAAAAVGYVTRHYLRAVVASDRVLLAVVGDTDADGGTATAKLGANGLALLAFAGVGRAKLARLPVELLQRVALFICAMQRPDGRFVSKYDLGSGSADDKWVSLYYPGEAALGLIRLHGVEAGVDWRVPAAKALLYLAQIRAGQETVEPDHWALIATDALLRSLEQRPADGIDAAAIDRIERHGLQVATRIVAEADQYFGRGDRTGCMSGDGRTCPTATRVEGLNAVVPLMTARDPGLAARARDHIARASRFLRDSVIADGPAAGGVPRRVAANDVAFWPAADKRMDEVRIDYVQHALSALLGARQHGLID